MKEQRAVTALDRLKNAAVLFLQKVLQENKIIAKNKKRNPTNLPTLILRSM